MCVRTCICAHAAHGGEEQWLGAGLWPVHTGVSEPHVMDEDAHSVTSLRAYAQSCTWRCVREGPETRGRQHTAVATGTGQVHCLKPVSILASSQESHWHFVFREKLKVYKWKPWVLSPRPGKLSCKAGSTQAGLPGQGYLLEAHGSSHTLSWIDLAPPLRRWIRGLTVVSLYSSLRQRRPKDLGYFPVC